MAINRLDNFRDWRRGLEKLDELQRLELIDRHQDAIPSYRLPRDIVRRDIEGILQSGIVFVPNSRLGRNFTLDSLMFEGFQAVFLAFGAHQGRRLNLEGETADGV